MRVFPTILIAALTAVRAGPAWADDATTGRSEREAPGSVSVRLAPTGEELMAQRALNQRTTLNLENEPLSAALRRLAGQAGVTINLDPEVLRQANVDPERGVSIQVKNATFAEALERLLDAVNMQYELRAGVIHLRRKPTALSPAQERDRARRAVEQALAKPVTVEFSGTSLENVIDFLQDLTGTNFVLDRKALAGGPITPETPIEIRLDNAPLAEALKQILDKVDLDYGFDERYFVVVTTPARARELRLARALERPVTMSVDNQPLGQVLIELQGRSGIVVKVDPEVQRLLPRGAQTPITLRVHETEAQQVYEFLGGLLGLQFVTTEGRARYEATERLRAVASQPATQAPDDPIVGRFLIKDKDGNVTELYIRRSDLPKRLQDLRQERIKRLVEDLESQVKEEE